ncbi:MAG TPA: ribosome recycling factor, partial [Trueperaceae bacterium]|nr:ribosome recycling factor [Trueperaceae bacterium]
IRESDLGFNPNNQGENIFINVPALNDERRKALVRTTKNMAEESRISIRNVRHDIIDELKEMEKENMLTEDDLRLGKEKVQEITDSFIKRIDERLKSKEVDILEV